MIDEVALLSLATVEFADRLRLVSADDWDQPTPCGGWDVRALVNHVVGANRRHRMLLHAACAPAAAATRTVDHLGADPIGVFAATAAELAAAFAEQGALDRTVHHPNGDRTGADLVDMRVLDLTVHAWDLPGDRRPREAPARAGRVPTSVAAEIRGGLAAGRLLTTGARRHRRPAAPDSPATASRQAAVAQRESLFEST